MKRIMMMFFAVVMACGVAVAQLPDNAERVVKTQLNIDWTRSLTAAEKRFLSTVPEGHDGKRQSFRELIEICFRATPPIAHAESAPRYGWKDSDGVVYNYAYYCRLLQPADAAHIVVLPPTPQLRLSEFRAALGGPPVDPLQLQPVTPTCSNLLTDVKSESLGQVTTIETPDPLRLQPVTPTCSNLLTDVKSESLGQVTTIETTATMAACAEIGLHPGQTREIGAENTRAYSQSSSNWLLYINRGRGGGATDCGPKPPNWMEQFAPSVGAATATTNPPHYDRGVGGR